MTSKQQAAWRKQPGETKDSSGSLQSLGRALRVLSLFTEDTALGARAVGSHLDLSPAVAHRILSTLAEVGFLEQDSTDRTYQLGWMVGQLGDAYYHTNRFHRIARQVLRELSVSTGETAALHVLRNGYRVCLMQHESSQPLRYSIPLHAPMPVTNGATDQVLRAFASEPELEEIRIVIERATEGIEKPTLMGLDTTEHLKIDFDSVTEKQLEKIRQSRYKRGLGLRESGVGSLATVVQTVSELFVLTLFGPIDRIESLDKSENVVELLAAAAGTLERN